MKVAYLINQYPQPSHSFIRREIAGLENLGLTVERISVRSNGPFLDPSDIAEQRKTRVILNSGPWLLLAGALAVAASKPIAFLRALLLTLRLGWRSDRGVLRNLAYLVEACTLVRWLRRSGADHLHAHFGTNSAAVAMLTRELGGPPYSFTAHGPEEFEKASLIGLDEKIKRARFVVAVSHYGQSQLCRHTPHENWKKLVVVHCGVDASFLRSELPSLPAAPRLVCVARLSEQKGHFVLLEALAQLKAAAVDFELLLLGDGPLRSDLQTAARELGIEGNVRFGGWVGEAEIRRAIADSRGLVLPSFAEGLPVVLMEALALGRPVVSTTVCGIPELVDADCGWLVPAGSVDGLAAALRSLLSVPTAQLERMGRAGMVRAADQHDAGHEAAKLAAMFRQSSSRAPFLRPQVDRDATRGTVRSWRPAEQPAAKPVSIAGLPTAGGAFPQQPPRVVSKPN